MNVLVFSFVTWLVVVLAETSILPRIPFFDLNLFFLVPTLFIFRWKGPEGLFLAAFYGLTVDSFSMTPFSLFAISFFLTSFLSRWFAVRMFQENVLNILVFTLLLGTLNHIITHFIYWDGSGFFRLFFSRFLIRDMLPTSMVAMPIYLLIVKTDGILKIRLSERKY